MTGTNYSINLKVSKKTYEKYSKVFGFDFGYSGLTCSFSDKSNETDRPITVSWNDAMAILHPTCIFYENWPGSSVKGSTKKIVGFDAVSAILSRPPDNSKHIPNIKKHLLENWSDPEAYQGPDLQTIMNDYFDSLFQIFKRLKYSESEKIVSTADHESVSLINMDECRFSFAIPDDFTDAESLMGIVRNAFISAGFLRNGDDHDRLLFVNDAVATAYVCLAAPKSFSLLDRPMFHLVVDIGNTSTKMAIMDAQPSDEMSIAKSVKKKIPGMNHLAVLFESYLTNTENDANIAKALEDFMGITKSIDLIEDINSSTCFGNIVVQNRELQQQVFRYFEEQLFNSILTECNHNGIHKVFFRGSYSALPHFKSAMEDFMNTNDNFVRAPSIMIWPKQPERMVSAGSVLFAFKSEMPQIPLLVDEQNSKMKEDLYKKENSVIYEDLSKNSYVVGIDFGTTFSGCSYANISNHKKGEERKISTIENWSKRTTYHKMPTALRYKENDGIFSNKWGSKAFESETRDHEHLFTHFKLLLSPENAKMIYAEEYIDDIIRQYPVVDFTASQESEQPKSKNARKLNQRSLTVIEIIAKYLELFVKRVKKEIATNSKEHVTVSSLNLKYVITVPAMWNTLARDTMKTAAVKAGLIKEDDRDSLLLIAEPEAAALSCEVELNRWTSEYGCDETMNFIVCDAGGGTVDILTFQRTVCEENGEKFSEIRRFGDPIGGNCGSALLDEYFKNYVDEFYDGKVKIHNSKLLEDHYEFFADKIKETFTPWHDPYSIQIQTVIPEIADPDRRKKVNFHLNDKRDTFTITSKTLEDLVFRPVVDKVVQLLEEEISKRKNLKISAVLMAGGFSRCTYLINRIKSLCGESDIPHVGVHPKEIQAISYGAVSYYLDPRLVSTKQADASFAMQICRSNDSSLDQLAYFTRKGSTVHWEEVGYHKTVSFRHPYTPVIAIFAFEPSFPSQKEPTEFSEDGASDITKIAEYKYEIPQALNIQNNAIVNLDICLRLNRDFLSVEAKIDSIVPQCRNPELLSKLCSWRLPTNGISYTPFKHVIRTAVLDQDIGLGALTKKFIYRFQVLHSKRSS